MATLQPLQRALEPGNYSEARMTQDVCERNFLADEVIAGIKKRVKPPDKMIKDYRISYKLLINAWPFF